MLAMQKQEYFWNTKSNDTRFFGGSELLEMLFVGKRGQRDWG